MNFNNKTILIVSPEAWGWQYVSKHHYAIHMNKLGYKVYFLNPPHINIEKIILKNTEFNNLFEVDTPGRFRGLRFMPKPIRKFIIKKWLANLENVIGEQINVIWNFENSRFYNLDFFEGKLKIYHQVDSNQNFHVKDAATSADICFCVTEYIKKDLLQFNSKVYKIPHGLSINKELNYLSDEQLSYFEEGETHAAYIGNLDMIYINEEIIYKIVNKYPKITFHFIGSYSINGKLFKLCEHCENVVFWGRVVSGLILEILKKIDINLLVYRVEEYPVQLANSHKILEYLYSGKVTVATYTDEYKNRDDLMEMVEKSEDFISKFDDIVCNLSYYNSEENQKIRISYAKENSYEMQLVKIFSLLKENNLEIP